MPPAPGHRQRPPRRNTGLIVGGSVAAAILLVAGVIVGVSLTSKHGKTVGSSPPTASAGGTSPSASAAGHTGTASLVGSLAAPNGSLMVRAFFSADGNYVAASSAGVGVGVYIFSAETLKLVRTLSVGVSDVVDPVSFSPDDKTLYAVDAAHGELYDLDIATGETAHRYTLPANSALGYSYGASVLDVVSSDGSVAEYEMANDTLYAQVKNPGSSAVATARADGDGKYVLISDTNGVSYLVDALSEQVVGTFHYAYSGSSTVFPQVSLDGNTVYVPGGSIAAAKLWDRATGTYITPTDPRWPTPDGGVTFGVDGKYALTSPASVSEVVDIWNIATRAHVITLTVPGGANEDVESVGPSGSELLSTGSLDISKGTFHKLEIWSIPG